ncbi:MAG: TraB/GumN family protein [Spirochaetaceae bacterium]|jgi:pheromone shutdown protein TraB|nr:TraB/GumN family protein [Spirochaetaceae bacterium]
MSQKNETHISLDLVSKTIILIGTAHVSKESVEEVKRVINEERPSLVCVEIDSIRYNAMTQNENWEKLDIIKVIREGKGFLLLANLVLSSFQRKLGNELGVKPGEEMAGAVQAAKDLNIAYSFCDREVQITLRRAWGACSFWSKCKLLSVLFASAFSSEKLDESEIENLKQNTELDGMMNELARYLPAVKKTLIDERDLYLAAKIWENSNIHLREGGSSSGVLPAQKSGGELIDDLPLLHSGESQQSACSDPALPENRKLKIVAVVGAGHLSGIQAHIREFEKKGTDKGLDLSEMEKIPKSGFFSKYGGWIIPLVIVIFVLIGLYRSDLDTVGQGLLDWALLNGSFAALGSLLAFANILTIIVSFISAPIGTLNPFLSVGLFAAVAQALIHHPRVCDAENLTNDMCSIRGIYRNRITHILLIFFLSSIGGIVGNVLAITPVGKIIDTFILSIFKEIAGFLSRLF